MKSILWIAVTSYASAESAGWRMWPFSTTGYTGGFLPIVAKFILVGIVFAVIALFLRLLFGPKGPLRGQGWETIQEARKREQAAEADSAAPARQTKSKRGQS